MKLLKVRVQNFKSIVDSGTVDIEDRVTVLVGKNEQGKTTFLKGLASWSPKVVYGPSDLPNHLRHDLENQTTSEIPIVTLWLTPESQDLASLRRLLPSDFPLADRFKSIRFYDGHHEHFSIGNNEVEEPIKFAAPNFRPAIDKFNAVTEALKVKLHAHSTRLSDFAPHLPQALTHLDQFSKAQFTQQNEIENLVKTLSTALRSLPSQDAPIQEDISAAMKEIEGGLVDVRKIATTDHTKQFEELIPTFVFHSTTLDQIPNEVSIAEFVDNPQAVSKGMANLCGVAGLPMQKIKDLAASPDVTMREAFEDTYNSTVSGGINEFWTQEKYTIHFRFEPNKMSVSISDDTYTRRIAPKDRSDGFQWYLSFYAAIQNEGSPSRPTMFLLDNPGLELHADGQRDIKRYLEERLLPNEQVIYVTHSPAMIDPFNLEQVRQVERGPQGTKVAALAFKDGKEFDLLEPVRSAIGASLASSLVLNEFNVLVEGAADKPILEGSFAVFCSDYRRKLLINGSVSESKDGFLVRFYDRADLPFVVFLDADANGRRLAEGLNRLGIPEDKILPLSKAVPNSPERELELEDVISPAFYHRAVQLAYPEVTIEIPNFGNSKRTSLYATKFKEQFSIGFNKRRVGVQLKKLLIDGQADEETTRSLTAVTHAIIDALERQCAPKSSPSVNSGGAGNQSAHPQSRQNPALEGQTERVKLGSE